MSHLPSIQIESLSKARNTWSLCCCVSDRAVWGSTCSKPQRLLVLPSLPLLLCPITASITIAMSVVATAPMLRSNDRRICTPSKHLAKVVSRSCVCSRYCQQHAEKQTQRCWAELALASILWVQTPRKFPQRASLPEVHAHAKCRDVQRPAGACQNITADILPFSSCRLLPLNDRRQIHHCRASGRIPAWRSRQNRPELLSVGAVREHWKQTTRCSRS